jgi:hypothetical protein
MQHLFKEGKFKEQDGKITLDILGIDQQADKLFYKSAFYITGVISFFDYKKLEGTDYYYIYKEYGVNEHSRQDSKEVENSLKKILNGNNEDVLNYQNLTLGCGYDDIENDIFWDVNNNIIFVKGEKNLKLMCTELLMAGYERLGIKRSKEIDANYISKAIDVPIIVKAFNLDPTKEADTNKKLINAIFK